MIPARVRPGRPVMIGAAVAVTALLGGAGVALAASSSPSAPRTASTAGKAAATPSPSPSSSRCQVKLPAGFPGPGRLAVVPGPFGLGMSGAIHGQFVTAKPGGGYETIDTQRGTVTAVSASSLTVKSTDGYTHAYRVTGSTIVDAQRDGIGLVKTGQTVAVLATVSGSAATATQVTDLSVLPRLLPAPPQAVKPGSGQVLRPAACPAWSIGR